MKKRTVVAAILSTLISMSAMATPESCNVDLSIIKKTEVMLKKKYDARLKQALEESKDSFTSLLGECADVAVREKNYTKASMYVDQMEQIYPKSKLVEAHRKHITTSKKLNDVLLKYSQ